MKHVRHLRKCAFSQISHTIQSKDIHISFGYHLIPLQKLIHNTWCHSFHRNRVPRLPRRLRSKSRLVSQTKFIKTKQHLRGCLCFELCMKFRKTPLFPLTITQQIILVKLVVNKTYLKKLTQKHPTWHIFFFQMIKHTMYANKQFRHEAEYIISNKRNNCISQLTARWLVVIVNNGFPVDWSDSG